MGLILICGSVAPVGVPSVRPPSGGRGHRVILSAAAAHAAVPSLIGKSFNFRSTLDGHAPHRPVGIITEAGVIHGCVQVSGHLRGDDFMDLTAVLRDPTQLALSYEVINARVADVRTAVWVLTEVTFTGVAVLLRKKAAYPDTWIKFWKEEG